MGRVNLMMFVGLPRVLLGLRMSAIDRVLIKHQRYERTHYQHQTMSWHLYYSMFIVLDERQNRLNNTDSFPSP